MNILDEINKECNDSFNEEIAQSKEDLPELFKQHEFHNKEELEFIFEEQMLLIKILHIFLIVFVKIALFYLFRFLLDLKKNIKI